MKVFLYEQSHGPSLNFTFQTIIGTEVCYLAYYPQISKKFYLRPFTLDVYEAHSRFSFFKGYL